MSREIPTRLKKQGSVMEMAVAFKLGNSATEKAF
jgi:hypothetical protein